MSEPQSDTGRSQGPTGDPLLTLQNVEVVYNEISLGRPGYLARRPQGQDDRAARRQRGGEDDDSAVHRRTTGASTRVASVRERSSLDGQDVTRLRADQVVAAGVAQVPEGRMVFGHLTIEENLRVGSAATKYRHAKETLDQIYELFPVLGERRKQQAGWMSGGEQQMIAIGRALMARPRLLLLDEVSLGLAPQILESIMEQLAHVRDELGTAMLMVEQNANLALEFSEYGYIMENGRVVLDGPSEQLRNNDDVKEFYLGMGEASGGGRKSYAEVKHYKRRKRWVA
jgi:branched-chain amino acid transport system ATP-binding protein